MVHEILHIVVLERFYCSPALLLLKAHCLRVLNPPRYALLALRGHRLPLVSVWRFDGPIIFFKYFDLLIWINFYLRLRVVIVNIVGDRFQTFLNLPILKVVIVLLIIWRLQRVIVVGGVIDAQILYLSSTRHLHSHVRLRFLIYRFDMLDVTILYLSGLVSLVGDLMQFLLVAVEANATVRNLNLRIEIHSLNLLLSVLRIFFIYRGLL